MDFRKPRVAAVLIILQLLAALAPPVSGLPGLVKVGILLHEEQLEQEALFKWSIEQVNQRALLKRSHLLAVVSRVRPDDGWHSERQVCQLLEQGVVAVVGPLDWRSSLHVGSICDAFDIPHMNIASRRLVFEPQSSAPASSPPQWKLAGRNETGWPANISPVAARPSSGSSISVDLSISRSVLYRAHMDVLRALEWRDFVYLYEEDDSLFYLQEHFRGKSIKSGKLRLKVHRFDPAKPYRDAFWYLKQTKTRHIMLDVHCSKLAQVLKHAQQVSMMTEAHSYLVVCLDTQTINLEDFQHGRARIMWLSSRDDFSSARGALALEFAEGTSMALQSAAKAAHLRPLQLTTESALIHDAVETVARALQGSDSGQYINMGSPLSCREQKPWPYGSSMVNYMRTSVDFGGMSGRVRFDSLGQRSAFALNLLRLTELGPKLIGNWTDTGHPAPEVAFLPAAAPEPTSGGDQQQSLLIDRQELSYIQRGDPALREGEQRDILIVTSIKNEPYFMDKQTTKIESGNARYEGYAIDLIDELSRIVGFDYEFKEVDDRKYGKYDDVTKEWNGMIREIMIGKADLAIADLSITSSREDAVDFTLPFMSTGISILFKKPTTKELELFSFLSPFEGHVWVYMSGAYIGVSLILFIVARLSPYEWADPHPCRQEDKILRNQFSVTNSFWFTIAALMQQGSDMAPRSLSTRLVSANWYFFTLIMISSYTANLAAFLTVEKVVYPIERAEDLYRHPQNIQYGCLESGSTDTFFQNSKPQSTFRKMYDEMVKAKTNEEGKFKVEKGNYAYFMESISIEYTVERNCNLTQIGGLLDSKGYGIGLAKNSTRKRDYRTKLSEAILSLQESGMLEVLKNRWWKEKRGGGACDIDDGQGGEGVKELTLANVGGVFVVLGIGITASFTLCAFEMYCKSMRLARAQGTTKWAQVLRLVKFGLSLSENY